LCNAGVGRSLRHKCTGATEDSVGCTALPCKLFAGELDALRSRMTSLPSES
jgi:hypothetical protein